MAEGNRIYQPGAFGGIMRYDEEYQSRFMMPPTSVIALIVAVIAFTIILRVFWPIG